MIPDEAVEAAARAAYIHHSNEPGFDADAAWNDMGGTEGWEREQWESEAHAALEAALPHLLSHEREETRLAHLDAVVNAQSADRFASAIDAVRELADSLATHTEGIPPVMVGIMIRATITKALV